MFWQGRVKGKRAFLCRVNKWFWHSYPRSHTSGDIPLGTLNLTQTEKTGGVSDQGVTGLLPNKFLCLSNLDDRLSLQTDNSACMIMRAEERDFAIAKCDVRK